jgi:cytochrome P450
MQHSKKIYGYDADIFRPERWLEEADSEKLARMKGTMGLVFGTGRYGCLGKNIALMELDKIFFEVSFHSLLCERVVVGLEREGLTIRCSFLGILSFKWFFLTGLGTVRIMACGSKRICF